MIDPLGDRVLLSGTPPIRKGETLELAYQGQKVLLKFEGARSNGAYFRDVKTKKLGLRTMTKLAAGIQKGNHTQKVPGAIREINLNQPQRPIPINLNSVSSAGRRPN